MDIKKEMSKDETENETIQEAQQIPEMPEGQLEIENVAKTRRIILRYKGIEAYEITAREGEKYFLIKSGKAQDIIIPIRNETELRYFIEKLILNIESQTDKKEGESTVTAEGEVITLEIEDEESITGIISDIDSLRINGKNIIKIREALQQLVEQATVLDRRGKIIDLSKTDYGREAHDYILEYLYGKRIVLSERMEYTLKSYKTMGYAEMNGFLRGQKENFLRGRGYVEKIVGQIVELTKLAESMPTRKFDIVLGRKGAGVKKSKEVGAKNDYDSFVSFGTDEGSAANWSDTQYKRRLRSNEAALPLDMIRNQSKRIRNCGKSECEMITLPFQYTVMECDETEYGNSRITMGKIKKLDIYQILHQRIDELKQYNEELGENADWVSDLHKLVEEKRKEKLTIEVADLTYLDDEPREKFSTEYKLQSLIAASKKSVLFGRLTSFVSTIKSKFMAKENEQKMVEGAQEK